MSSDPVNELSNSLNKFTKYALIAAGENKENVEKLIEFLGERLVMCPGSIYQKQSWSRPGGLIDYSLNVALTMTKISKALNKTIPEKSIFMVAFFHNIGMVGDLEEDYLIPQKSDWHIKQGMLYAYNEKLRKSIISHRSLFLLQSFGISLTHDEWTAISISGGLHKDENKFYIGAEPSLATLLIQARSWVEKQSGIE
jgi:hypothetical protein